VSFPTWTEYGDQDDLAKEWWNTCLGTKNGDIYTFRVNASDHNNEEGLYITHSYATDKGGNQVKAIVDEVIVKEDPVAPVISDVVVTDVSSKGYTVTCKVTDNVGVSYVAFPTWTEYGDQDDLIDQWWATQRGTQSGDTYTFRVNVSDHNYETGHYNTHIYAFDESDNQTCYKLENLVAIDDTQAPVITNVFVSNITTQGYTVTCRVTDDDAVGLVAFPTWTTANGQVDLDEDDLINQQGTQDEDIYIFCVNIADHDMEYGEYNTCIYARDRAGNISEIPLNPVVIQAPVIVPDKISLVEASAYSMDETLVLDVKSRTTVQSLLKEFEYEDLQVKDQKGQLLGETARVGTGCTVELYDGDALVDAVQLVILGDLDSNGIIDTTDYMRIKSAILGALTLDEAQRRAADVDGNGVVDITDYMRIKSHILKTFSIE
jgi:hypothetical protein